MFFAVSFSLSPWRWNTCSVQPLRATHLFVCGTEDGAMDIPSTLHTMKSIPQIDKAESVVANETVRREYYIEN